MRQVFLQRFLSEISLCFFRCCESRAIIWCSPNSVKVFCKDISLVGDLEYLTFSTKQSRNGNLRTDHAFSWHVRKLPIPMYKYLQMKHIFANYTFLLVFGSTGLSLWASWTVLVVQSCGIVETFHRLCFLFYLYRCRLYSIVVLLIWGSIEEV